MKIQEHISLKELTTMKIGGTARYFCSASTREEVEEAVLFTHGKKVPVIVLGGGSNILIASGEINALVLKIEIKGIEWATHGTDMEQVVVGAGESWDGLVARTVEKGFWGIENLSGIPGTTGAAPIQNIGAYGTEVKDTILWVEVFDIAAGKLRQLTNAECRFSYRDSIFKKPEGKALIVTRVAFALKRGGTPNLEYKDLKNHFAGKETPPLTDIRNAVLEIRGRKFPDLSVVGTAGSFFKNPIIPKEKFDTLKQKFPDLPGFPMGNDVKIPLAWILDNVCNLKGATDGNVGMFKNQPIVLVNFGGATFEEVMLLAKKVADCVREKTGIDVECEVQQIK
ncbi:MAG: UDP-N-acetylmuramate dehydrogenase [Candidatus Taylorbacteria bacterium]|nr:UDP-N-acetylmuramate dehydrogenase [Candidatus Taylorbacteria bacterium]